MRPTTLHAIARGKLGQADTSEELLTSIALGTLAWLPARLGLLPLLATCDPAPPWLARVVTAEVELWPWWDHAADFAGAEPDGVLRFRLDDGSRWMLAVEAKRGARKSGTGEHDQLARQAASGAALAEQSGWRFAGVLYLTEHLVRPRADLDASHAAMAAKGGETADLWWTSWRVLRRIVLRAGAEVRPAQPMLAAQCDELAACLHRWRLARFEGVSELCAVPALHVPTSFQWPALAFVPPVSLESA